MKGKIALCSRGIPGILTSDEPVPSKRKYGTTYYPGVSLLTGEPWGAEKPVVLGTFTELLSSGLPLKQWIERERL